MGDGKVVGCAYVRGVLHRARRVRIQSRSDCIRTRDLGLILHGDVRVLGDVSAAPIWGERRGVTFVGGRLIGGELGVVGGRGREW